jgi:hypothetical protein
MMIMMMVIMIERSCLEKKTEKQNGLKAKVISVGPFCFGDQHTIESLITFRIDDHTIRGELLSDNSII